MLLKKLVKKALGRGNRPDYRTELFQDLLHYANGSPLRRLLEIGPKDGKDTERLLSLGPDNLTLVDLPGFEEQNSVWLSSLASPVIEYHSANFMYDAGIASLEKFDCIWCTGVLYHNPEQLRMIKKLYDLLNPGGVLVIESATTRQTGLRDRACVEIVYPPSDEYKRRYHISKNVTHLPSRQALKAWLGMVGFEDVQYSQCHRKRSAALARARAAFICRKPTQQQAGQYYAHGIGEGYDIGKAL
jgi:SAM-dependent methyltransferase